MYRVAAGKEVRPCPSFELTDRAFLLNGRNRLLPFFGESLPHVLPYPGSPSRTPVMLGVHYLRHVCEDGWEVGNVDAALNSAAEVGVARQGVRGAIRFPFDVFDGEREALQSLDPSGTSAVLMFGVDLHRSRQRVMVRPYLEVTV